MKIYHGSGYTELSDDNNDGKTITLKLSKDFNCPNIVTSFCKREQKNDYGLSEPEDREYVSSKDPSRPPTKEEFKNGEYIEYLSRNNNGVAFTFMYPNYALTIFAYPDGTSYIKKA